ncbi:hypothetical protein [Nitrospirillum amazonense]|uniref:hypothetical protein n=1 Tax=Nitrospirillum amazonense TaxID=28077 RepID=UPI0024127730|nr:hypothetical protein [Nitrospirillum amazonense]MDG3444576.1 hypothetical protein [Nitrospirillum amazonense]
MSYRIVFRQMAILFPFDDVARTKRLTYDSQYLLLEEGGDNNLFDARTNKVARDWTVLAAGMHWQVIGTVTKLAAAAAGGSLRLRNRQTTPEGYIGAIRRHLADPIAPDEAKRQGVRVNGTITIGQDEVIYDPKHYERLAERNHTETSRDGQAVKVWTFNLLDPGDLLDFLTFHTLEQYQVQATRVPKSIWNQTAAWAPDVL